MLTRFFEKLMAFLFGRKTPYLPYRERAVSVGVDRVFIKLEWITYRRWGGLFQWFSLKQGLPKVTMAFNPGVPDYEFKASCASTEYPDFIVLGSESGMDAEEFAQLEAELKDTDELPDGAICMQWRCVTVVRSAGDLMELYDWLDDIELTLTGDEYENDYDSPLTPFELELFADTLGTLTEGFRECQLNS